MSKNSPVKLFIQSPLKYLAVTLVFVAASYLFVDWFQIALEKVIPGFIFLTGLYLLFYFLFVFIQKKYSDKSAFIFLILMGLKLVFIIAYLFLFLNPSTHENKTEILLFLMNYFALLIIDLTLKVHLVR